MKHIVIDARNRRSSTGRYTDRLIEHLQIIDQVNRYTLLVEHGDPLQLVNNNFTKLEVRYPQFSFNPLHELRFALLLYRLRPALVHFVMTQQPVMYFGKIVTTTHDLTMLKYTRASRFPSWLHAIGVRLYRAMFRWSHIKSKKIIVPSNYVAADLSQYQPRMARKIVVTHESSEPPMQGKAKRVKGVKKPFIMHTGSPFPHKNIERLIAAFDQLKEDHPDLQLVLPGRTKDQFKEDLDAWIAAAEHTDSIVTPGFVSDQELKWLYQNAECYVLPSLSEGFGLPGLEAMAHDCPLVSSNATCLPEIYESAAEYFDPRSTEDMADAVARVLRSPKLQKQLVNKGHKQLKKYSWQKMVKETLQIYNSI